MGDFGSKGERTDRRWCPLRQDRSGGNLTIAGILLDGTYAPIAVTREASVNGDIAPPCLAPRRSTISVG